MMASLVPPTTGYEAAIVSGSIRAQRNISPKQLIRAFDQFVASLHDNPNLDVSIVKRPFGIESGKSFAGDDNTIDDVSQHTFAVQITRKLQP